MTPFQFKWRFNEKQWLRSASDWERGKFALFWAYLGDDRDEKVRVKIIAKRLMAKKARAHMPGRHAHAPIFGLRRRPVKNPRYVTTRTMRQARSEFYRQSKKS